MCISVCVCIVCVCMCHVCVYETSNDELCNKEGNSTDIEERGAAEGEKEGRVSMFD